MKETLKPDSGLFVTADPFRCRLWALNARIQQDVTETSCRAEIDSIRHLGQLVAVLGRPVQGEADADIEVIYGSRRLLIARHLKRPLRVELRDLTDRQAAMAVRVENSLRCCTSPYEQGLWLANLLKQNLYPSQDEMARELRINPTTVNRLLKFADLPATVIGAFASPHDILESWAVELHKASSDERQRLLTEQARAIKKQEPRPPSISVYEMLMGSLALTARRRRHNTNPVVMSSTGELLLRFERQRKDVVLRIPSALVDIGVETAVRQAVIAILTGRTPDECATAA